MKKMFAMLLALAMVLGMSMTAFAVEGDTPPSTSSTPLSESNSAEASVENVETGATVMAYRIVKPTYVKAADGTTIIGVKGYETAAGISVGDPKAPTQAEVTTIAANTSWLDGLTEESGEKVEFEETTVENKPVYKASLRAGYWIVIVTSNANTPAKIYNPLLLGVHYTSGSNGNVMADNVSATENWSLNGETGYAKSTEITLTKTLEDKENNAVSKVGEVLTFNINSTVPSYDTTYYKTPVFAITDEIVNGLAYYIPENETKIKEPVVTGTKIIDKVPTAERTLVKDTDYRLTYTSDNTSFTVTLTPEYIQSLVNLTDAQRAIRVSYQAEVTDSAVTNVGENQAKLVYSTNPTETNQNNPKTDKEYVFTFALNNVLGKVDGNNNPLKDAEFTLYSTDENGTGTIDWNGESVKVSTVGSFTTADETKNKILFKGLDGDVVYYLKETKAPDTFSLNDTVYKVEFVYDKNVLEAYDGVTPISYTVKVTEAGTGKVAKECTVSYGGTTAPDSFGNEANGEKTNIVNTKVAELPSTGGIGTTIFTIAGCLIMVVAAGLFFASRRKSAAK